MFRVAVELESFVRSGRVIATLFDVRWCMAGGGEGPIKRRLDGVSMPDEPIERIGSTQSREIEGKYANYFQIGHNALEFLLDFGQLYSNVSQESFHTRVITSPSYAKELLKVLGDAIEQYEQSYGSIRQQ